MGNDKKADKKEATLQESPKIDMKALNAVVKKVLDYGPAKKQKRAPNPMEKD